MNRIQKGGNPMLIKNATLLNPGTEPGIYDILVQNGKIARIEPELDVEDELELDVQGMFVTPGLVDAHTHLGLKTDSEGPFYADHNEKKSILSPEMRAIDAIDPQSVNFREAREAGITTCASGPGSLDVIGGQYACIKTAGTVIDDMVLDPYFAMKCALGENPKKAYETTRMGIAATLRNFLFQARAYAQDPNRKFDMKLEPMIPVIRGEKALKIHCHAPLDIVTAVRICDEFHLKFTLDHVTCGVEVLDFLQKRPEIPLLLGPSLGARGKVELHGKGFANVVKLAENRDVCLITDAPVIPLQYLPICAGLAISKGMPYEKALEAVTINPARVMGVEARVGSLAPGKDADLVIWKDRPFVVIQDPVAVFINGERI